MDVSKVPPPNSDAPATEAAAADVVAPESQQVSITPTTTTATAAAVSQQKPAQSASSSPHPPPLATATADDDTHWRQRIAGLQHEFNAQRARMKEMFLQKESDCKQLQSQLDEARSQLAVLSLRHDDSERHAQDEIVSLQQLVRATIDESAHSKAEYERLLADVERLRLENGRLNEELCQQESSSSTNSLAPVLSHVKKTIARKLGADTTGGDYLEDSMRKAQEDAEVLRSLVVPLEEEIKALKEKLRTTDEELQSCHKSQRPAARTVESALVGLLERPHHKDASTATTTATATTITTSPTAASSSETTATTTTATESTGAPADASDTADDTPCPHCARLHIETDELRTGFTAARTEAEHFRAELEREAALRRDLELQWQEKRDQHKHVVQQLDERVVGAERELAGLRQFYAETREEARRQIGRMTAEREQTVRHLEQLQNDNDFLAGRFAATAAELQNERIDLPGTVDELQVCLLRIHEDLIESRVGYELEQRRARTYAEEVRLLAQKQREGELEAEQAVGKLRARIGHLEAERAKQIVLRETLQQRETEAGRQAAELRGQEIELRADNERLTQQNAVLRQKSTTLQQELANSETVQQDFVRLSQSLQVELEKIRAADSTVRWQTEDDVDQCPSCRTAFAVTRRQVNCRHCGTIYCEKCITKTVLSGRQRRPARVCDVCHTLLERNTAPYFSQAPPQSPT